jgi:hypothetical protein
MILGMVSDFLGTNIRILSKLENLGLLTLANHLLGLIKIEVYNRS